MNFMCVCVRICATYISSRPLHWYMVGQLDHPLPNLQVGMDKSMNDLMTPLGQLQEEIMVSSLLLWAATHVAFCNTKSHLASLGSDFIRPLGTKCLIYMTGCTLL